MQGILDETLFEREQVEVEVPDVLLGVGVLVWSCSLRRLETGERAGAVGQQSAQSVCQEPLTGTHRHTQAH